MRLEVEDDSGNHGERYAYIDLQREFDGTTWRAFLDEEYRQGRYAPSANRLAAFGDDLHRWLVTDESILPVEAPFAAAWQAVAGRAGRSGWRVRVEFGDLTGDVAALPFELLRQQQRYLFREPGSSLERTFRSVERGRSDPDMDGQVLFAWARPAGLGSFDPKLHERVLQAAFGDRLKVLPEASLDDIGTALADGDVRVLHLLAHGFRQSAITGVVLHAQDDGPAYVETADLARRVAGHGVQLAFLCSCQTALAGDAAGRLGSAHFGGVGQQLLAPSGGDVPWVVASQGNLAVDGAERLVERFYALLGEFGDPSDALARARLAYGDASPAHAAHYWSVPVVLARQPADATCERQPGTNERPAPRTLPTQRRVGARPLTYQDRTELVDETLAALAPGRVVTLVGLPGIGKTAIGLEVARRLEARGEQVLPLVASLGFDVTQVRAQVAVQLGLAEVPEADSALGAALAAAGPLVLLIDNAEDLMREVATQRAFAAQLDVLAASASELRVLLTSRWPIGFTRCSEREVHVPPMPRESMDTLLRRELEQAEALQPEWPGSPAWERLLDLLDGHPRTLWLIAGQLAGQRDLPRVLARLETGRANAARHWQVLGNEQAYACLEDRSKDRLISLVASMGMSYEVVRARHPGSARLFLELSLFPSGLPRAVAFALAGGDGLDLDHLVRTYHLVEWSGDRYFFPVPVGWFAEQQREEEELDDERAFGAVAEGYVTVAEAAHARMSSGAIVAGRDLVLAELPNLMLLANRKGASAPQALSRLGAASAQALLYAHLHAPAAALLSAGLQVALATGDRLGESNTLRALGELRMQRSDLQGAEDCYRQALPIYQDIEDRLGEANTLRALGDLRMLRDDLQGAEDAYQQALPIYQDIEDRLGEANTLQVLGDLYMRRDDLQGAEDAYQQALPIYQDIEARLGEANTLQVLGYLCMRRDDLQGAEDAYQQALPIYQDIECRLGEANTLKSLGDFCMRCDDLQGAEDAYQQALPIYQDIEDRLGEANTLKSLGDLCMRRDDLQGAEDAYQQALPVFQDIESRLREANTLKSLGDLRMRCSDLQGADDAYQQALRIYQDIQDRLGEANTLKALGDLCLRRDDLRGAEDGYQQALPIYRDIEDRLGEANILQSLGDLRMRRSDLHEAEDAYQQALFIFQDIEHRLGEANTLKCLGDLCLRGDDLQAAEDAYQQALRIYQDIEARLGEVNTLQALGLVMHMTGRFPAAWSRFSQLLETYVELEDGLGVQAALGYLARTAAADGQADRALVVAEVSLMQGRRIESRFGQTINLALQLSVFSASSDKLGVMVTAAVLVPLYEATGQVVKAAPLLAILTELRASEGGEQFLQHAEEVRATRVADAAARLQAAGVDPLGPWEVVGE